MKNNAENSLSEKIAKLVESEMKSPDLASLFASMEKLSHRLDKLESSVNPQGAVPNAQSKHPSTEKFAIAEAIADEIFAGMQEEKACTFEPNGKPCDHCAMCSSRGF
ncbi:MAG TPA: hypothetical protein VMZ26_08155 [Pyrinomonadaceae bacterium]|nr:hypothetical protein [Pyrinomonadaceae bacterium]